MKHLVIILVILIVLIYIKSLFKIPQDFTLIQVDLTNIHPDHVHEKQPILVYDKIVNPIELLTTVFKYYFISIKKISEQQQKNISVVKNTFLILHARNPNAFVNIKHPKQNQVITINMNKYNVLMVPYKWKIESINECDSLSADSFLFKLFCLL